MYRVRECSACGNMIADNDEDAMPRGDGWVCANCAPQRSGRSPVAARYEPMRQIRERHPLTAENMEASGWAGQLWLTSAKAASVAFVTQRGGIVHISGSRSLTTRYVVQRVTGQL